MAVAILGGFFKHKHSTKFLVPLVQGFVLYLDVSRVLLFGWQNLLEQWHVVHPASSIALYDPAGSLALYDLAGSLALSDLAGSLALCVALLGHWHYVWPCWVIGIV